MQLLAAADIPSFVEYLPHVNVSLNALATCLLILGFIFIKAKKESAHKTMMLSTFGVNVVFLVSYLTYHAYAGSKKFPVDPEIAPTAARYFYYGLLLSHVLLAAVVPILAVWTIVLALKGKRESHKKLAKWTWPIWLYVSVTGVLVYLMLYQIYVPPANVGT